ncbi:hypothetical protein Droror1_Dr00012208 [Drosera rotundifolia]
MFCTSHSPPSFISILHRAGAGRNSAQPLHRRCLRPQTPQSPPLLHSSITPVSPSSPHHTESQPRAAAQSPLLVFFGRTWRCCVDLAPGTRIDWRRQCGGGLGFRRGKDGVGGRWWPLLLVVAGVLVTAWWFGAAATAAANLMMVEAVHR